MHALSPLLKHWLQLQCQMIHNCNYGLLAQQESDTSNTVLAVWPDSCETENHAIDTAKKVISQQRLHISKPHNGEVFLGYPVKVKNQFWGTLVVRLNRHDSTTMKAVIRLLDWGLNWLQFILFEYDTYIARALTDSAPNLALNTPESSSNPSQALNLLSIALREPSPEETAISIANFLASHFDLERVSIGLKHGNKIKLAAVSFSANFDPRTLAMQNILGAMQESWEQRQAINFPQRSDEQTAPSIIRLNHQRLLKSHKLQSCHTFLLRTENAITGAITIEHTKAQALNENIHAFIENSARSLATIFHIKQKAHLSLAQLIRTRFLNGISRIFGAQHPVERLLLASSLIFIVALFLPSDFNISNKATVESTNRHLLVSPYEGFLGNIYARPGELVKEGQLLASLRDEELNLERRKLSSQLQQFRLEYDNALANGNRAQAAIVNAQVEQSRIELRLIEQKLERIQLKSPISGIVVSEDISQSLGAPLEQGEVLFEIADSNSYRVTLYVDEKDIRFIQPLQQGKLTLKSLPGKPFEIEVEKMTPLSEGSEGRNFFRVEAKFSVSEKQVEQSPTQSSTNSTELSQQLRPGMTGSAKIFIERRALGWIWFHDIWNWLRLAFWF